MQPSFEVEGLYIGRQNIQGADIVNTSVEKEHVFDVTYPISASLGLMNAILYFENSRMPAVQPYVGAGFGLAAVSIHNANSIQVEPIEPGINHYNTDPSDTDTTFATQLKLGLNYKTQSQISFFGEYRYLYLSSSDYTFGSTYYNGHKPTTNWTVKIGGQQYNLGVVGVKYHF